MNAGDISFPNLGIHLTNVPQSFSVFGFSVALYGMMIAVALLAGASLAAYLGKKCGIHSDNVWDIAIIGSVSGIIGARIYYVVFSFDDYRGHLIDIFNIRQGGLAIYGGIIASLITIYVYTRKKKINLAKFADVCFPGMMFGQVFGRFGNFFNREAFGDYTNGLFAMRLPVAAVRPSDISEKIAANIDGANTIFVHPTFLYEAMWNLFFVIVFSFIIIKGKKLFDGQIVLSYLTAYGIGRFWIESLRTDSLMLGNMRISQLVACVMTLSAGGVLLYKMVKCGGVKSKSAD